MRRLLGAFALAALAALAGCGADGEPIPPPQAQIEAAPAA